MKKRIRYNDLEAGGIVNSRMTLSRMIRDHGFPPGRLVTPNCRTWTEEEVEEWLANRPEARKPLTRKAGTVASTEAAAQA